MSVEVFCELEARPFDSFCGTHSMSCCSSCHTVAYPECKLEELSEAIAKMEADIKEYEASLGELISKAKDRQESVPGWLTKQDGREKAMLDDVKQLFSEVRRIVDDCEQNALSLVNETISKQKLAARSVDQIVSFLSKLLKERQGSLLPQNTESCSNEGMAIQSEEDVPVESHAASRISAAKMADSLNKRSVKLRQATYKSKTLLNDFENLSPIDYQTVLNKKALDSLEKLLKDSYSIVISHKPVGQLVKDVDFTVGGSQPVMSFLDKSAKSDIIIAAYNPNTLMVVNQSGKTIKSVALTNNYQPFGVCQLNGCIYVTHYSQKQIAVYQASNLGYQTSFSVAGGCRGIDVVGDNLVVACYKDYCVRMITTSGGVVAQSTHSFGGHPLGLAVTPNASTVVVANHTAHQVVVLSADLATHLRTIPCGGSHPWDVCVYGTNIYVSNYGSNQVMELSHDGQSSRSVISVNHPIGICINSARRCFMVSTYQTGLITSYMAQS